jgi:D-alanine-D-alanine ligase
VKAKSKPRVVVIYNRDFEQAQADPENLAREDVAGTAERIIIALRAGGHDVRALSIGADVCGAVREIDALAPAAVFNLCESIGGDNRFEALVPMLLDLAAIPYTGSAPLALSIALHKDKAKEILRANGIATPRGVCVAPPPDLGDDDALDAVIAALPGDLRLPLIVKPAREDASVGISSASVVRDVEALRARVRHVLRHYRQPAIVEEFIEGREINVSVLARVPGDGDGSPQVLPLSEIDFSDMPADRPRIVSFEGKWVESSDEFHGTRPVPCELPTATEGRIRELAVRGFAAMQLRDYGRFDVRLAADGTPYVIDVNPNCDLSEQAGFARAARAAGIAYDDLVLRIAQLALSRRPHADPIPLARRSRGARSADRAARDRRPEPVPTGGDLLRAGAPGRGARSA